jgi:hypothetical protein
MGSGVQERRKKAAAEQNKEATARLQTVRETVQKAGWQQYFKHLLQPVMLLYRQGKRLAAVGQDQHGEGPLA